MTFVLRRLRGLWGPPPFPGKRPGAIRWTEGERVPGTSVEGETWLF